MRIQPEYSWFGFSNTTARANSNTSATHTFSNTGAHTCTYSVTDAFSNSVAEPITYTSSDR